MFSPRLALALLNKVERLQQVAEAVRPFTTMAEAVLSMTATPDPKKVDVEITAGDFHRLLSAFSLLDDKNGADKQDQLKMLQDKIDRLQGELRRYQIETCDFGHKRVHLDGQKTRCPVCLEQGIKTARRQQAALAEAMLKLCDLICHRLDDEKLSYDERSLIARVEEMARFYAEFDKGSAASKVPDQAEDQA